MKQQSQTNLLAGIGAITAAVVVGYFGLDYFTGKKVTANTTASSSTATPATESTGEYAAAINAATDGAGSGESLNADDARRIGEEVARQVAAQVAQAIVDQGMAAGSGGGLTEADARRIGEEEGRRVAQEVAAAAVQQALAATGGGSGSAGLTAEEAEQIGISAGRRAAKQVAASTARDVVRSEFGGSVATTTAASGSSQASEPAAETEAAPVETAAAPAAPASNPSGGGGSRTPARAQSGADALRAWWSSPASGDFGLLYAGQPKGEAAIALLFSGKPGDSALDNNVKVYDAKGALVSGSWEAAANPRMAVLRGLQPGRYTVVVAPALADANGKSVSKAQHGPVYVI